MKTIQELFEEGRSLLEGRVTQPALEAKIFLLRAASVSEERFFAEPDEVVSGRAEKAYFKLIDKRRKGMALAYVIEEREFWSLPFKVVPGVFIPSPETELLVEKVLDLAAGNGGPIVDIGTGCGNVAICLARGVPKARVIATDISLKALKVAKINAVRLKAQRIAFVRGNLFSGLDELNLAGKCDFIVSNPPYVAAGEWEKLQPNIRIYEPRQALVAGETGLEFIRRFVCGAPIYLKPGGYLLMETGDGQRDEAISLFDARWRDVRAWTDLCGIPRVICAQLTIKGA